MDSGKANELDIISGINGYHYKHLNPKWQSLIKRMFPKISPNDEVKCYFYRDRYAKPDIVIQVKSIKVYVSIKSGHNPSCHQESFPSFVKFLRKCRIPERYIRIITFYHFGRTQKLSKDGESFTRDEIIEKYGDYLVELNNYLLTRSDVTEKIIYRAIIRGTKPNVDQIDYFYYGNVYSGFLLSRNQIHDLVMTGGEKDYRGAPHFGALVYQANGRKDDRIDKAYVRIKWPVLCLNFYDQEFVKKYS